MAVFSIKSFGGIAPVTPPRYLQDSQAQTALNCPVFRGSIQPLTSMGSTVATLTKTGTPKSIYRFGQDTVSDNNYWFHWLQDVDVCRSQIAGDVSSGHFLLAMVDQKLRTTLWHCLGLLILQLRAH